MVHYCHKGNQLLAWDKTTTKENKRKQKVNLTFSCKSTNVITNSAVLCISCVTVTGLLNGTAFIDSPWSNPEKWVLVTVLGLEMTMGVMGNSLALLVKVLVRRFDCSSHWCFILDILCVENQTTRGSFINVILIEINIYH